MKTSQAEKSRNLSKPEVSIFLPTLIMNPPLDARQYAERKDASITLLACLKSWIESGVPKTPEEADELAWRQYVLHIRRLDSLRQGN